MNAVVIKKKYYAKFDDHGNPTGFFPSDIWPVPPDGAVQITTEQYTAWMNDQGIKAYRYIDGVQVECDPVDQQKQYQANQAGDEQPAMTIPMSYAATLNGGIAVTSASKAIEPIAVSLVMQQLANLASVSMYTHMNGKFPGGQDTLSLTLVDGSSYDIPTIEAWQEIAMAAQDFVTLCEVAYKAAMAVPNGQGSWVAPSNVVTIS